jgi:FkbM family methyltransferase
MANGPASWLYNLLVRTTWVTRRPRLLAPLWYRLWEKSGALRSPVRTVIHGRQVVVNCGYTYPVFARRFPSLNAPLLDLTYQTFLTLGRPLVVVDVGAAVGDTLLLLHANCPEALGASYGIEGDPEFIQYLRTNLASLPHTRAVFAMLAGEPGPQRELVRTHAGTARAQGPATRTATTLDAVLLEQGIDQVDLLKLDADGMDGRILRGSVGALARCKPAVIFEWHPLACRDTATDWSEHFDVLQSAGYDRFVWFTKYGEFSHFSVGHQPESVTLLAGLCLRERIATDRHYDVIALHRTSEISDLALAEQRFSRERSSRC